MKNDRIRLTNGDHVLVDSKDYKRFSKYTYYSHGTPGRSYATRYHKGVFIRLAREILDAPPDSVVMYRNGNTLDCRRKNICCAKRSCIMRHRRKSTNYGGRRTSSRFKGVTFDKQRKKWRAQIRYDSKIKYLGAYNKESEAAHAYDLAAVEYYRRCALLNFPDDKDLLMHDVHGHTMEVCT